MIHGRSKAPAGAQQLFAGDAEQLCKDRQVVDLYPLVSVQHLRQPVGHPLLLLAACRNARLIKIGSYKIPVALKSFFFDAFG